MNVAEQFSHWNQVHRDLLRALDLLADEQLNFVPRQGHWSLGRVARHIAGAKRGWIRFAVTQELSSWPDFPAQGYATVQAVEGLLSDVHADTMDFLESLDPERLDEMVGTPWGEEIPLRWIIWHVLEHDIHHRGEIYLMLGLMGIDAPEI